MLRYSSKPADFPLYPILELPKLYNIKIGRKRLIKEDVACDSGGYKTFNKNLDCLDSGDICQGIYDGVHG